jgi:hypothetical protein
VNTEKYIGLDVHQATIAVALLTKAATILEFFAGLRGTLSVIFEEAGLYRPDSNNPHIENGCWRKGSSFDRCGCFGPGEVAAESRVLGSWRSRRITSWRLSYRNSPSVART